MKSNILLFKSISLASFFLFFSLVGLAQSFPVTGKVIGASGEPLNGVTIQVKNGKLTATSKTDGTFQITAPSANATLVFSYVGFTEQQVAVKNQSQLTVSMTPSNAALENVVVVGYGTQRKRDVTGAVATFDAKSIEEKPIARVDQAMIGQMPGVQVRQQTSLPGAGFSIQVRGTGSISAGNEPLYVIDGFPLDVVSQNSAGGFSGNPLNNINPNDIESIQVLKDASAGAIYGSRAANGVVIITTKRGQVGKAKINVNAYSGISMPSRNLDVLSPDEWIAQATELENYRWVNSGAGRTADQTNAQRRAILNLPAGAYNTTFMPDDRWAMPGHPGLQYIDWQNAAFKKAAFQNYEISAGGGTQAVRYFFSGNYLNQGGVLLGSGYRNYSARGNVEVNATKGLKLGLNIAPSYSENDIPLAEGKDNQLMKIFNMTPIVEDTAGLQTGAGKNAVYPWATSSVSPVAYLNNTTNRAKTNRTLASLYAEYQVVSGLSLRTSVNFDNVNQNTKRYISDYVAGNQSNYLNSPGKSSSGTYSGYIRQNFVNENTINFNKTFNDKHSVSAVAGMSYSYVHSEAFTIATAGGFSTDLVNTLNYAAPSVAGISVTGNTTESNNSLVSYYGRIQYGFEGKYLFSTSIRRDASSRFGSESRWGTFPSLSAGWRISDEKFFQDRIKFINDLKLRASWGKSGNNNIGDYSAIPTLTAANYSTGGNSSVSTSGLVPNGLPNPYLHWETANTYDIGLDASFLHNRITFIFDAYKKKNTDLLLNVPVPTASGFSTSLQNIGAVQNTGIELALNTVNVNTSAFRWSTNGNIAFNSNKVLNLGSSTVINVSSAYSGNPPFLLQLGLPMYSYYLIKTNGILTADDIANAKVAKLNKQTVGDAKYVDANGDGIIDANDRVVAGQPTPKYTWGFTNNFKYKNFDLSIQLYGQHGGSIYSFLARAIDNPGNGTATNLGVWRDRWTVANQNYSAPRGKISAAYTIPAFTTDWLYSSDFWRVQNITLGYNLTKIRNTPILNGVRLYASMQNWFGHDKYTGGANPEAQNTNVSGNGSYSLPGDYGAMPLNKTVTVGVNLTL